MPKFVTRPVGQIHEIRKVKTLGDKVKDFLWKVVGYTVGIIAWIGLVVFFT